MRRWLPLLLLLAGCPNTEDPEDAAPRQDAASLDAKSNDAESMDAESMDAESMDAESMDAESMDAESMDAESMDAESMDAESMDAESMDAETDAGTPDSGFVCGDGIVDPGELCDPLANACCNSTCDAPAADRTACTVCPAGQDCSGCFGGACLDSRSFCSDILDRGQSTGDGVYFLRPALTSSTTDTTTVAAFCDMTTDGGGWTMVYKKSRLAPGGGDLLWSGPAVNTGDLSLLNRELATADYSNAFQLDYWGAFTEARVEVVTGTITQQFIQFDLTGSTPLDWYATDRHTASSWTDLPTDPNFDNGMDHAFRIGSGGRTFYINRVWGTCPVDRGWLMISSGNFCFWEVGPDPVDILYSRLSTESNIPNAAETGHADTFVIFLR